MLPLLLLSIQTIVFSLYVLYIWKKFGTLNSISESYYVLPNKYNLLFTFFTWGVGVPMLFYGNILMFLSGSLLCFVGAATQYKDTPTSIVHNIGAIGSIILGFATVLIKGMFFPFILFLISAILIKLFKVPNSTWWVEISAFLMILISIYLVFI